MFQALINSFWSQSALCTFLGIKFQNLDRPGHAFVDSLMGMAVVYCFSCLDIEFASTFWHYLHYSIGQLEALIIWLTQNPAGLKLNDALNKFLSNFFLYHIHLWRTYVTALQHSSTNWLLIGTGVLGLSVLIAFVSDFLRVITVHMFCFHVYTHRLAKVSWSAFLSFGRAFRGKKWNPLRQRIDSVQLDTRQLFLATLFFIILLFLLPTIGVYFAVFGSLWKIVDLFCAGLNLLSRSILRTLTTRRESTQKRTK